MRSLLYTPFTNLPLRARGSFRGWLVRADQAACFFGAATLAVVVASAADACQTAGSALKPQKYATLRLENASHFPLTVVIRSANGTPQTETIELPPGVIQILDYALAVGSNTVTVETKEIFTSGGILPKLKYSYVVLDRGDDGCPPPVQLSLFDESFGLLAAKETKSAAAELAGVWHFRTPEGSVASRTFQINQDGKVFYWSTGDASVGRETGFGTVEGTQITLYWDEDGSTTNLKHAEIVKTDPDGTPRVIAIDNGAVWFR